MSRKSLTAVTLCKQFWQKSLPRYVANEWLYGTDIRLYVRKSHRTLNGKRQECFDIANIDSLRPGKGNFTRFLKKLETVLDVAIYVENVLDERFQKFFERNGYTVDPETFPPCYYKIKELHELNTKGAEAGRFPSPQLPDGSS